jgi:hypothetical protein
LQVKEAYDVLSNPDKRYIYNMAYPRISAEWRAYNDAGNRHQQQWNAAPADAETRRKDEAERLRQGEAKKRREAEAEKKTREEAERRRREEARKAKEELAEQRSREAGERARQVQQQAAGIRRLRQKEEQAEQRSLEAAERARQAHEQAARAKIARQQEEEESQRKLRADIEEVICKSAEITLECKRAVGASSEEERVRRCDHQRWWRKVYGAERCYFCKRMFPIFTMQCPACETKACVLCKIQQVGR